jgi:cytochrome c biogenesis protein
MDMNENHNEVSEQKPAATRSVFLELWRQFSSMKFAIILLVVIAVVSVLSLFIGEFYPVKATGPGWQEFWHQQLGWSKPLFNFFTFLELHDPYRSWWYQILLFLLSLSLFACILERIPIALRAMRIGEPRSAEEIDRMNLSLSFTASGSESEVEKRLPGLFRYRKERSAGETRYAGLHGAMSNLGPILAHTGMLGLVLGGFFSSILGFSTRVSGVPGDLMTDPGFDFAVRVDSFKIEYHPLGVGQWVLVDNAFLGKIIGKEGDGSFVVEVQSHRGGTSHIAADASRLQNQFDIEMDRGNIRDYISVLTVIEGDREIFTKRIEVNHPLRYRGFRFYQASFDPSQPVVEADFDSAKIVVTASSGGSDPDTIYVRSGATHPLPDGSRLRIAKFLPDFKLDGGKAASASAAMRNPALLLQVSRADSELYHQWSFLKMDFPHTDQNAAYTFQALDIAGAKTSVSYPTILEVNRNPGSWVIWLGFILATLGLILSFYLVPQRLWVAIRQKDSGRCEVHIGGVSSKNPDLFKSRVEHWAARLKGK